MRREGQEGGGCGSSIYEPIIEGTFEPLNASCHESVLLQCHEVPCKTANTFRTHGITLVSHGGGTDLSRFEGFLNFL